MNRFLVPALLGILLGLSLGGWPAWLALGLCAAWALFASKGRGLAAVTGAGMMLSWLAGWWLLLLAFAGGGLLVAHAVLTGKVKPPKGLISGGKPLVNLSKNKDQHFYE